VDCSCVRLAVTVALLCLVAGCAASQPGTTETTHGPADLGRPLQINVQNPTSKDAVLRFTLAGQDPFTFRLPADPGTSPNVGQAYSGSVPPESTLHLLEPSTGATRMLDLPPGSAPVYVHVQFDHGIDLSWSHEPYGYD